MNKPKQLAAMLALLLAFVMLFSVLFLALEADHDCCGEDCAVCAQLHACEDLMRNLLVAALLLSAAWCFCALLCTAPESCCHSERPHTLVLLKVKLSN